MSQREMLAFQCHKDIQGVAKVLSENAKGDLTPSDWHFMRVLEKAGYLTINLPSLQDGAYPHESERLKKAAELVIDPPMPNSKVMSDTLLEYRNWKDSPTKDRIQAM